MDSFMELSTELTLLTQQLAHSRHQRARSQVWNQYISMDQVQYRGNPYLNTYDSGWQHYPNLPWETSQSTPQPSQRHKSSLEETMAELRKGQANLAMVQAENERSMADFDYVQNGLPRFHTHNQISQLPQEKMANLEATVVGWRRFQLECETFQANFMEEVNQPPQEELIFENEVDELSISMVELAKNRAELCMEEIKASVQFQSIPLKSLEETITPKATSHTQSEIKIEQHPQRKELSIEELMAQYMKKEQQRSFPTNLDEKPEKEDVKHKVDITLKSGGELEKPQRVEDDAHELKELVTREDEPTSPESHDTTKYEVLKTILEMAPWGEMHEEFKIARFTPMSKLEECIV